MKKLVFVFAAFAAISFASCGGNKATEAPAVVEEEVVVVDSTVCDSTACDSTVADTVVVVEA